jgi:Strictosidine synthase
VVMNNGQSTVSILNYVNDLDIDHDNDCVYFTSSTTRGVVAYNARTGHYDTMRSFLLDLYSADISGRLLQYNFLTRATTLVMDDIWYANGVVVSPDKDYVLVVETCGFRVIKKWLTGPKAGQQEDFIANLPGFPDGITLATSNGSVGGGYWISLVVPLSPILYVIQSMAARYFLSWLQLELLSHVVMLQKMLIPKWACVIHVSPSGEILEIVLDPNGSMVSTVSAVTEHNGKLFMGNLGGNFVSIVDLSK